MLITYKSKVYQRFQHQYFYEKNKAIARLKAIALIQIYLSSVRRPTAMLLG
ncbi:MAG: hypothetical protein WBM86_30210 [Waterburya sp.]